MSSFRKSEIYFIFVRKLRVLDGLSGSKAKYIKMIGRYLKERVKHAVRFRHKRGYGVHSPFMFNFILNVIRDRRRVFVYPEGAERQAGTGYRERRFYRLLFRIAVFLKVRNVVCFTQRSELLGLYLQSLDGAEQIKYNCLEAGGDADMVYIGRECRVLLKGREKELLEMIGKKKQCVFISDIHKNSFNASLWRSLAGKANVRVDMMWYGILLFDEKLQKGSYHLML